MNILDNKLNQSFPGKVVRKDLLHEIKKAVNVPSYVLEFLLSRYCASDDPEEVEEGKKAREERQLAAAKDAAGDTEEKATADAEKAAAEAAQAETAQTAETESPAQVTESTPAPAAEAAEATEASAEAEATAEATEAEASEK